jgi:hypothetical protein
MIDEQQILLEGMLRAEKARNENLALALQRADDALSACQIQRDQWHKIADERSAELIRLATEVSRLRGAKP